MEEAKGQLSELYRGVFYLEEIVYLSSSMNELDFTPSFSNQQFEMIFVARFGDNYGMDYYGYYLAQCRGTEIQKVWREQY